MRGEIGAVRSAIEAAENAVEPIGKVVNVQIIAKPEEAISIMYK
jgi:microcompartment protein CcmL/EutN